jgi:hypothetical protein
LAVVLKFLDSAEQSRFSRGALFGGVPQESDFGKPFQPKSQTGKYHGNTGLVDSETLGECTMTTVDRLVANASQVKHVPGPLRDRAMRDELLASVSDAIRPSIAAYPKDGSWLGLMDHFLATCGPQNIRTAVQDMLDLARADTPVRTLKQRIVALVDSWQVSQVEFCRVHPEFDDFGDMLPPCASTPFVAVHDQLHQLKLLILDSVPTQWQTYCSRPEYAATKNNPVPLLDFMLALNQEALQTNVVSKRIGTTQLRVHGSGSRPQTFATFGEPSAQKITMSLSDAKSLEHQGLGTALVETIRVSLEPNRSRSVPQTAMRFCLAANISESEIRKRHEAQQC